MDEYIKREDALIALLDAMVGTGYQSRAMDAVKYIPSADVVSKVEADFLRAGQNLHNAKSDELKAELELRNAEIDQLKAELEIAKLETARKVVEEIESIWRKAEYCAEFDEALTELKKKYETKKSIPFR